MPSGPVNSPPENPRRPIDGQVSLAQIAASGIAITWYEAIAIVQQVCRTLLDQPGHPALDSTRVFVDSSGDITIHSSSSSDTDVSVQSLGELLRIWLAETPYPMPLKLVVAQATCTPPFYTSVAELSEALSHYERSNRHELVRGVYEHWRNAGSVSSETPQDPHPTVSNAELRQKLQRFWQPVAAGAIVIAEFTRSTVGALLRGVRERWQSMRARSAEARSVAALREAASPDVPDVPTASITVPPEVDPVKVLPATEQIASVPRDAVAETTARDKFRPAWKPRVVSAAIAAIIVALLMAAGGWAIASRAGPVATSASAAIGRADDQVVDALASAFGSALNWLGAHAVRTAAVAPAAAAAPPAAAPVAAPVKATPRATRVAPLRSEVGSLPVVPAGEPNSEPETAAETSAAASALPAPPELPPLDTPTVYSVADADVTPPVAIAQQLSDSMPPGLRQQDVAIIDIVVDEAGRVESATLAGKPATLQEAMLATMNLSAAKTWRFRPALKAGRPVKYRRTVWLLNR